jgi:hypothetical protein
MGFQEDIRKQQLLDKINVIRTTTPEAQESDAEPISKSLFDEFEGVYVETIYKSLNVVGDMLGEGSVDDIEKAIGHKYFKREGAPGHYKYYYTEADYKSKKSMSPEERDVVEFDEEHEGGKQKTTDAIKEKAAYPNSYKEEFKNYSKEDHLNAAKQHESLMKKAKAGSANYYNHAGMKSFHTQEANKGKDSDKKEDDHKSGDRFEYGGETIHVGKDTSGGQNTITYKAPGVSDKTYWDLTILKKEITNKKESKKEEKKEEEKKLDGISEDSTTRQIRSKLFSIDNQDQKIKVTTSNGERTTTVTKERHDLFDIESQDTSAGIKKIEFID